MARLWSTGRRWLWPRECVYCGRESEGAVHHATCAASLPRWAPEDQGVRVAEPGGGALDVWSGWVYCEPLAGGLLATKSALATWWIPSLRALMAGAFGSGPPPWPEAMCVLPVPADPRRLRHRGFDLAAELAESLAWARGLSVARTVVQRRPGRPQRGRSGPERRRLPHDRYSVAPCPGVSVVLVDDVLTTGATLGTLAFRLRSAGARCVTAVTLARAGEPERFAGRIGAPAPRRGGGVGPGSA